MILRFLLSFSIVLFGCFSSLDAQMRITEYMYSGTGGEFIEFTNIGVTAIDMSNWSYDDNSQSPDVFDLSGFGIVAPGESVIITEDDAATFRIVWDLDASVKVLGSYTNDLGRNDEINLYDANDALIDQLTFGDEDFPGTIRTDNVSGWTAAVNLGDNTIETWVLSSANDAQDSFHSLNSDIGNPGMFSVEQLAIWTFDDLDNACSGTELTPTAEDARGTPYLQQFFQEIDDNGKGGTPYTDGKGVMHSDGKAIAWDDIKGSGDDAELWITLSTIYWTDIAIRFDYRINDDGSDDSYDLEYSTDGGFTWIKPVNNQTLIDDDNYHSESIDLSTENALENQACVIFRFSDFDNDGNNEFRFDNIEITGTKTAPDARTPFIRVNSATTIAFLNLNEAGGGFVSGVINDPTDPAATSGIEFILTDADTPESSLIVTASSADQSVVTDANLSISGSDNSRKLTITPTGVGYTDIRVEVTDGTYTDYYLIKYAASAQLPSLSYCHTGVSDASTAIAIDANHMLVADDENEVIRLYDRNNSGLPINTFDFTRDLDLGGKPREVDIEASVQVGNRIYWLGSHSNNSSGEERPNRSRLFATDISGTGTNTDLSFVGFYEYLKDDLVAWDAANGHGLGANFLGLAASTADGVVPEAAGGFNIEGLDMAPGSSTTAYMAFRAPIEPASNRTKALIVPVTNFTTLVGASSGSATFGAPIQLDLSGRGIRSLASNDNGEYIIVAGPSGSSGPAPNDFQLYYWDGMSASAPAMIDANPLFDQGVSFESIVALPTPLNNGDIIQMLADNGDTNWYGDGERSKDLPQANFQKFCSGQFVLDLCAIDATPPVAICQDLTIHLDAAGDASIFASSVDNGSMDECGIDSRSLDQSSFTCENVGPNTVVLTVTDANGNTSTCNANVLVEDNIAPTAICKNTTVEIQPDGMYILMENDVFDDINSFDNCEISNVTFTATTFTCDDIDLTFPIMVTVTDPSGNSDDCTANVLVALGDALPDGWSSTDIGNLTIGNDYSFDPCTAPNPEDGEFTIIGSGNNAFSTTTDNVAFASQSICGDGSITAKIESVGANGYGGLMIRETNDANSKQVALFSNLTNILRHETRYLLGANKVVQAFNRPGPVWLKLERQGDWFFAYYSTTGNNFQYVHAVYVPMNSCVEIGLASFTYQVNQQTEVVFSHVDVQGGNSMMPGPITDHQSQIVNTLTVYPNPAQHFFKLQLEQPIEHTSTVQLLSPLGQLIESKEIDAGATTLEWSVYNLPAGMYLLKLELDGVQTEMKQLMIVR